MDYLFQYGLFLAQAVTVVVAIGLIIGLIASVKSKEQGEDGAISVEKINDRYETMEQSLRKVIDDADALKKEAKEKRKQEKRDKKSQKKDPASSDDRKRLYLIDFEGDIKASAVAQLREVISAIQLIARPQDEVILTLESAGGMVHSYGLAASQLDRLKQQGIKLTVCVDKVAASGGYMMACVADTICTAPFAIIGSIGVVAQLPNFHRLLKKNDVDFELLTAGEYKRTLTMFGENTDKGREKFVEDLELTHTLFKEYVKQQRPVVDIESVATGEIWFGSQAKDKQLVDVITTSDDYISQQAKSANIYKVSYTQKKTLPERLGLSVQTAIETSLSRLGDHLQASRFLR